jgi:hypothetical protein
MANSRPTASRFVDQARVVRMPITRPYRRNARPFTDTNSYSEGGGWRYIRHPKFAKSPEQYVRGFLLLQKDLLELFDYIEPADKNLQCYSYRIHEILLRACVEIEANCKAILLENAYCDTPVIPFWRGDLGTRAPFSSWKSNVQLRWYKAYNDTKHNRHAVFSNATFEHALDAICGLAVILSAQFFREDFGHTPDVLGLESADEFDTAIGGYFRIRFPNNWEEEEKYSFVWENIKDEADPFLEIFRAVAL